MPIIRKTFGEFPMKTIVNTTEVTFDTEGVAEVEQDIFDALLTVPGFEANEAEEESSEDESPSEDGEASETPDEESSEDESTEEAPAPKPSRKRPSIKK